MSEGESTNDLAIRTLAAVKEAVDAAYKYNDFGSVLGAQDEASDIEDTLCANLRSASRRARRLVGRIRKWEAGERFAERLNNFPNDENQQTKGEA